VYKNRLSNVKTSAAHEISCRLQFFQEEDSLGTIRSCCRKATFPSQVISSIRYSNEPDLYIIDF